jgi:predicted nucleic acid-binding Zn ribbon protein
MDDREIRKTPSPLGDVLSSILKNRGWETIIRERKVFGIWEEAVGGPIARNAQPDRIERGVLIVRVRSSSWAQELTYMKDRIITRLNERLNRPLVTDMRFIQGTIDAPEKKAEAPAVSKPKRERPVDTASAKPYTDQMEDSELKEILTRVIALSLDRSDETE